MKITQHIHQRIRIKNWLYTLVILALLIGLAWLSRLYSTQIDLTENERNTLSAASQQTLTKLPDSITITAYISDLTLRKEIRQLIEKFRRVKKNITLRFEDPAADPEKAHELNIGALGAIIIEYQGRTEKVTFIDEATLTNTLLQLSNVKTQWITFLQGHGERSPTGRANFDLGLFGNKLEKHKIKVQTLNLAQLSSIPDNSSLLILASPKVPLLAGELEIISEYIAQGGNLLLLTDPGNQNLSSIEQQLGIHQLPGTVVDGSAGIYGIDDPTFALISHYTTHPITQNFDSITVFPVSSAFEMDEESDFTAEPLLTTSLKSWTESGKVSGKIRFDPDSDEQKGPLVIAYALTRDFSGKQRQRIVVIGDGDFLSNAYLGNVGNAELGFRIINWLTHDDQFIQIPTKSAPGRSLHLTKFAIAMIGAWFLLVLPCLLLLSGFIIWRRRKRR